MVDGEPILVIPDALDGCSVESLAFHPDGRHLAVAGIDWMSTGGSNGAVSIWDTVARCEVAMLVGGGMCIAYHPSGKHLAAASLERSICVWDPEKREIVTEFLGHEGSATVLQYNSDGTILASGGEDRILRLSSETGDELAVVELDTQIRGLAFSPDGEFLYTANANTSCYQFELFELLDS